MPKARFSSADVRAMVRDLRGRCLGMRVVNVFDINDKTYLIKLANPGVAEKVVVLLESGIRFHTTRFERDKADMPSGFSMKLRKHVRAKRLEDISQLGIDRVVDFRFGSGETCNHIILEMYSGGNIILTDEKYEILALLRTHKFEENVLTAVKEVYPIEHATTAVSEAQGGGAITAQSPPADLLGFLKASVAEAEAGARGEELSGGGSGKAKALKKLTLKLVLQGRGSGLAQYGADLIHHVCLHAKLQPDRKMSTAAMLSLEEAASLLASYPEADACYEALNAPDLEGRILTGPMVKFPDGSERPRYDDVVPLALLQHENLPHEILGSFDEAVDRYFARFEEQKLASAADHAEASIKQRVEKIRADQQKRLEELEAAEALAMRRAVVLERRASEVDQVIAVLKSAVASGVGWVELADYVTQQQDLGNPIALMVHRLKLETSQVVVLLEDDEAPESAPALAVDINLEKSAYSNARDLFAAMKVAAAKKDKTALAAARVVGVAEKQSVDALQKHYQKRQLKSTRKIYWFEKFNWFITSENYLVLAGRDAQQNDTLVKKYLKSGDAYVHADLHGAASCVVLNKDPKGLAPLSPLALHEAGCMTVCRSGAWKAKIFASAWWVHAGQVSKTAPTGEYLSTGSFMIRGKKNFLPPVPLEMGLALLFKLDDSCLGHHVDERKERSAGHDEDDEDGAASGATKPSEGAEPIERFVKETKQQRREARALAEAGGDDEEEFTMVEGASSKRADARQPAPSSSSSSSSSISDALDGGADNIDSGSGNVERRISRRDDGEDSGSDEGPQDNGSEEEDDQGSEGYDAQEASVDAKDDRVAIEVDEVENAEEGGEKGSTEDAGSTFVTPRERKQMKKRGLLLEQVRAEARQNKPATSKEAQPIETPSSRAPPQLTRAEAEAAKAAKKAAAKAASKEETLPARGKRSKVARMKAKYRDFDEEDLALHKLAVGHEKRVVEEPAGGAKSAKVSAEKSEQKAKAELAVATVLRGDVNEALLALPAATQDRLAALQEAQVLQLHELGAFELKSLGALPLESQVVALQKFEEADLKAIGNKSGLLSGIMHRLAAELSKKGAEKKGGARDQASEASASESSGESSRAAKKRAELEMKELLAAEGVVEVEDDGTGQAGSYVVELNKLTGLPRLDDTLLFAVPVCAPYAAVKNYKYKVKLTPGVGKKGRTGKQAVELFARSKECVGWERDLVKMLDDAEVINAIIGEAKINASGMHAAHNAKRKAKQAGKKKPSE